jgi:hypothetical protein
MSPTKNNNRTTENPRKNKANNDANDLKVGPARPGKSRPHKTKKNENPSDEITSENKIKSYKEGNRDDSITEDDNKDYEDIENDYATKKYPDEN